jgi:hypothetical protein
MAKFEGMIEANNAKQAIRALGDGISNKLTLIALLFLPASFSTSIFGMQSILPPSTRLVTLCDKKPGKGVAE